ncbi:hypothetical protein GALMADRAFT_1133363 [Galerina marginata CBS 339.88]|uniref:Uncharacterized protein n=1 Tax=Galerina marginata (strain CBS 339.88) TaxID=685588 RepID=A0A067S832_GALM3|nr:hypothetical protein GALMADRAFT_1133363 [Galerina marginata CBS 339.88]
MPSTIPRPRSRFKTPLKFGSPVEPEDTIPYLQTLQEVLNLTRQIDRAIKDNIRLLRRTSGLSRWLWEEARTLPISAVPAMVVPVQAYNSILQEILKHLERDSLDGEVERGLNSQIDLVLDELKKKIATAQPIENQFHAAGSSGNCFFPHAQNLLITGGNFINQTDDTELRETSKKILQAVYFQTIVLFY